MLNLQEMPDRMWRCSVLRAGSRRKEIAVHVGRRGRLDRFPPRVQTGCKSQEPVWSARGVVQDLLARIGFGCGRLRGGFEESSSRRLLDEAVRCGISYFDTAPYYGASEAILGSGLRGARSSVQVCTKVGLYASEPSKVAELRGVVLAAVRAILPDVAVNALKPKRHSQIADANKPRGYGNFDPMFIRRSVERSLEALQTGYIDCLMLHEPSMSDPTPNVAQLMGELIDEGKALKIGVGTHLGLDELPRYGDVAQFAIGRSLRDLGDARSFIGHGLFRRMNSQVYEHCVREAGVLETLPALKRYLSDPLGTSALLLNAVLFGTDIDRVLVSTASSKRLRKFVSTAADVHGDIRACDAAEIGKKLGRSLDQYFARESAGWRS